MRRACKGSGLCAPRLHMFLCAACAGAALLCCLIARDAACVRRDVACVRRDVACFRRDVACVRRDVAQGRGVRPQPVAA